jgi:hypothetical protein
MAVESGAEWVPTSCSLPTAERPLRAAEFDRLFSESVIGFERVDATRLRLGLDPHAEGVARSLADRESGCCSIFDFTFDASQSSVTMSVVVPESHADVLDALARRVAAFVGTGR